MSGPRPKQEREPGRKEGSEGLAGAWPELTVPGWAAPVLYAAVTLLLFGEFVFSTDMLFGTDTVSLGYAARQFYADAVKVLGVFPLWNPYILGGTPFVDSLVGGDVFYPTTVLKFFQPTHRALGWKLVLHVFAAGTFAYGWLRCLDRSRAASLVGGLAYLLGPFMVTLVFPGHDGKLFVTALTPLMFWAAESTLRDGRWLPFAGAGLVVALVLLTPHYQMAYFLFGGVGLYYLFRVTQMWRADARERAARKLALFLAAAILGAGVASAQMVPALRYVTDFSRRAATTTQASGESGAEYSSSWSLHPEEVASLLVPEFTGNDASCSVCRDDEPEWTAGTYWGRNPFKLNHEYAGLLVLLLAPLALFGRGREGASGQRRWFLLGLGILALLYALGRHTPVWWAFYELVPGISLFRAPSMAIFLFGFSAVTLFAAGLDRLGELSAGGTEAAERGGGGGAGQGPTATAVTRWLWGSVAFLALLALLAAAGSLTSAWTALVAPDLPREKAAALQRAEPFITRGLGIAVLLAAGLAGAWHLARREAPGLRALAVGGIALLVVADLWRVDAAFVRVADPDALFAPSAPTRHLAQEAGGGGEPFRAASLLSNGQDVNPVLRGVELATGHHPNDLARYRELIGMEGSGLPRRLLQSPNVSRVLNVRYLIAPTRLRGAIDQEPLVSGRRALLFRMPEPLPRAYLVGKATVRPDSTAVAYLTSPAFRPEAEAVLPAPPPVELPGEAVGGSVRWTERRLNRHRLRVEAEAPSLLVVSDNWYPAWHARVDGEPAAVLRANHTLRAVPVPAGEHEVEMYYRSRLFRWSLGGGLLALAILVLSAGASWYRSRRKAEG